MGSMSIWHWLIVLAVVLIVFGGGSKISGLMGDFGKGLNAFRKNIADEEQPGSHAGTPIASLSGAGMGHPAEQTASVATQGVRSAQPELAGQV